MRFSIELKFLKSKVPSRPRYLKSYTNKINTLQDTLHYHADDGDEAGKTCTRSSRHSYAR